MDNIDISANDIIAPSDNTVEKKTLFGNRPGYPRLVDTNAGKVDEMLATLEGQQKVAVKNGWTLLKTKRMTLFGIYNQEWRICKHLGILDDQCELLLQGALKHYEHLLEVEFKLTVEKAKNKVFEKAVAQKPRNNETGRATMLKHFIESLQSKYPKYKDYIVGQNYLPGTITMLDLVKKGRDELDRTIDNLLKDKN